MGRPRRRYYRSRRHDVGNEYSRRHIEQRRQLTHELGGTDQDVEKYFLSLPTHELGKVLNAYENKYGRNKRDYAEVTIPRWRSGDRRMGGEVAERFFNLLPPMMPLPVKYELIGNLWKHVGPSSKKVLKVGLDTNIDDAIVVVRNHIEEVVVRYQIPETLERRFNWLAAGDAHIKQQLLNHLRQLEKSLVVEGARKQLPVMLAHLRSEQGVNTHRLAQVLCIGKHELEVTIDKGFSGVVLVDPTPPMMRVPGSTGTQNYTWVWWVIGAAILLFLMMKK